MFVPFDQLPETARVWVYQMDRPASPDEERIIVARVKRFCETWASHKRPVCASFRVLHSRFLALAADDRENPVGGCSIDTSTRALYALKDEIGIDFFDRLRVVCRTSDGLETYTLAVLKERIATGMLPADTLIFDNLVATKKELAEKWEIPVHASRMASYLLGAKTNASKSH